MPVFELYTGSVGLANKTLQGFSRETTKHDPGHSIPGHPIERLISPKIAKSQKDFSLRETPAQSARGRIEKIGGLFR